MKSGYSKKVMDHFLHPRHLGKIKNPDGVGDTENLRCGDIMRIYIKVGKKKDKEFIKDIKFETLGCAAAIASSDMICELAKGKILEEAKKVGFKDVADELGFLPSLKLHCANLAESALKMAIENYEKRKS
ncbi:MAG: iron-sulfur cluster assembly scaffold protein [Candidatus Nealsonbacteria bacterium]|nr:iron-sulfur cluster assembly scaffold protein [Candidatus Nealsonbacteria bacterium]